MNPASPLVGWPALIGRRVSGANTDGEPAEGELLEVAEHHVEVLCVDGVVRLAQKRGLRVEPAGVTDLPAHLDTLTAERDELAATLANERGEGPPPSEGWAYVRAGDGYLWRHAHGTVERRDEGWAWRCYLPEGCGSITGVADTAREGMRTCLAERGRGSWPRFRLPMPRCPVPTDYRDSSYAHERVGATLCCEYDAAIWPDIEDGDTPKCVHCREDFEHYEESPHPCVERIALALEAARELLADHVDFEWVSYRTTNTSPDAATE